MRWNERKPGLSVVSGLLSAATRVALAAEWARSA